MARLVDWESLEKVHGVLGGCPDCCACSGVVVEGRVNEEGEVLVVNGR